MLKDLDDKVGRAKRDMKMIEMEVRVLDPDARNIWKGRLKGETASLKDIIRHSNRRFNKKRTWLHFRDLEWARTSEGVIQDEKPIDPSQMTEVNLIDYGNKLISETNESADTTIRMLDETKQVCLPVFSENKIAFNFCNQSRKYSGSNLVLHETPAAKHFPRWCWYLRRSEQKQHRS
jgi:hypothetical protein